MNIDKKNEVLKKVKEYIFGLNNKIQKQLFMDVINIMEINHIIPTNYDLEQILISEKKKEFDLSVNDNLNKTNNWLEKIYFDEIQKIQVILSNDHLLKKINGAKILLSGKTGTGKTQLVKKIIELFDDYNFINKDFTSMISSKMGQTQINLLNLAREINELDGKKILFIDEIDSIISNRINSDLGEHSRIIATFLQFLDQLDENVVFFAATNIKNNLDEAVLRRFNIKIDSRTCNLVESIEILNEEGVKISKKRISSIKKILNKEEFNFSEIKNIIDKIYINSFLEKELEGWEVFIESFKESIFEDLNFEVLSRKELSIVKKCKGGIKN